MKKSEAQQLFDRAQRANRKRTTFTATLGDGEGALYETNPDGTQNPSRVWAIVDFGAEAGRTLCLVRCRKVQPVLGLDVQVGYGIGERLEVVEEDADIAEMYGEERNFNVPQHGWMHSGMIAPDPVVVEGQQLRPLMVRPSEPAPDLNIVVEEYSYQFNGVNKTLPETVVDMSSYLPTDAGAQTFVIVCLDPDANDVVVVDSGLFVVPFAPGLYVIPFDPSDVDDVDTGVLKRSAAVRLYEGHAEIVWLDIFRDLREVAGPVGSSSPSDDSALYLAWGNLL